MGGATKTPHITPMPGDVSLPFADRSVIEVMERPLLSRGALL
jgi:hypothetical protein